MSRTLTTLLSLFLYFGSTFADGTDDETRIDLHPYWMQMDHDVLVPFEPNGFAGESTIYFELDLTKFKGGVLSISSRHKPSVFIDGQLVVVSGEREIHLSIDSLRESLPSNNVWIAIHQPGIHPQSLSTSVVAPRLASAETLEDKPETFFRDFMVVSVLLALGLFLTALYLNPKMASDYFTLTKLFSSFDREEIQVGAKVASSTNLLFIGLLCVELSLFLKLLFHFMGDSIWIAWFFNGASFWSEVYHWIRLMLVIFVMMFLKIAVVFGVGKIFQLGDVWKTHLFNWTRLNLLIVGVALTISLLYYFMRGINPSIYNAMIILLIGLSGLSALVIFSKVARRASYSWFHIFSYLCATELIPLLISIKLTYE